MRKISSSDFFKISRENFAWLGFIGTVFILTNLFAAGEQIRAQHFNGFDIVLTYGFVVLWGLIEALGLAVLCAGIRIGLQKWLKKDLKLINRGLLALAFLAVWLNVLRFMLGLR